MLSPEVTAYLESAHRPVDPILLEVEQRGRHDGISMISRSTGRLLSVLVACMQANRVLELGTAYGYSTLWMALALPPAGKIWTIDPDNGRTTLATSYFERAGVREQIDLMNQPALEVLPLFPQRNLDIVFIDAVKTEYEEYLELCLPLLKLSGLVVVHNLLRDEQTRAFNRTFLNHSHLDATILPFGDGTGIGARIR